MQYLFGPVPSRRLGMSLGVDLVPCKVCSLDCIYCQVGRTTQHTLERKSYVPIEPLITELNRFLGNPMHLDYITLSGAGEPTLNRDMGRLIRTIKQETSIPVALITNSTLFYREDVRQEACLADLVIPSLDAPDPKTFERINRPVAGLTFEQVLEGLVLFSQGYQGRLWLEIFLIESINTHEHHIEQFRRCIQTIAPDRVQLNTAVRPTAEDHIKALPHDQMERIARMIGPDCEIVASAPNTTGVSHAAIDEDRVLSMLRRHPCSMDQLCTGLGVHIEQAQALIDKLESQKKITSEKLGDGVFYRETTR